MTVPLQAVIFDWGGTLTPWHTVDLAEQWRVYARVYAQDHAAAEELAARLLDAEDRAWARTRHDGGSARVAEVLAEVGIGGDVPRHALAHSAYEEFWEPHTITDPDVRPLFAGLRERGLKVGVLSNTIWSREYHDGIFTRDGVLDLIDGAVYSSEIPYAKPHPRAFAAAAEAVGAEPAGCIYVGDRPFEDVHGAQRAGMRAVLVPHSDLPAAQQVPVEATPDAVVQHLIEVLDVVDRMRARQPG